MNTTTLVRGLTLAFAFTLTGCGLSKNTKVAETEVERFHQRWNAAEFQAVYDDAHMNFRSAQPAAAMIESMQSVKKHYGNLQTSARRSWGFNSNAGVTDVKLSYDSAFEHGAGVENFVFRMTGEKALLVSYDIMTPETAAKKDAEKKEAADAKRKAEEEERKAASDARQAERDAKNAARKKP